MFYDKCLNINKCLIIKTLINGELIYIRTALLEEDYQNITIRRELSEEH